MILQETYIPNMEGQSIEGLEKDLVFGGPNEEFLEHYRLKQHRHLIDWVTVLLLMTLADNLEDAADANVKRYGMTKFALSNYYLCIPIQR